MTPLLPSSTPLPAGYTSRVHRQFPKQKRATPVDPLSPEAALAWRFMRDQGGYWTAGELGRALLPETGAHRAALSAGRWLSALLKRRNVARSPLTQRVATYGVTGRCFPIPGESLEPLDTNNTSYQEQ